ncbi:HepT-like ribonuclease domain-containing protein [Phyllobacterium endophyticum]|uniref:HepT-like ribonuclease domain-containing protein n=1 Tax=Phyllobacterium endophyticum TaxID=1149773 RepID=UPI0011C7EB11|nr:DUF86 domain-containing protein [Phyllobacterium endophyticum]TXR46937.1 DUF86 domain-containing protein [Phyllobacterium endophyticum]
MKTKRLAEYLDHIRQAAIDAEAFVEGMSKSDFLADRRTQQAVVMSIIIVGEAATKVLERHGDFAKHHPEIAWHNMRGMRNRIAHGYFDINLDIVWNTVQSAFPLLIARLQQIHVHDKGNDHPASQT